LLLVAVVIRLVRAADVDAQVSGLLRSELRQLYSERVQRQPRYGLVEALGQRVPAGGGGSGSARGLLPFVIVWVLIDLGPGRPIVQLRHVDLVVEVSDVAHDRLML